MLTSWKQTRTSFECAVTHDEETEGKRKAKRKGVNGSKATDNNDSDNIVGVFVQPSANDDNVFSNPSSANAKKKGRKHGGSGYSDAALSDVEPLICLTSQHRVAFLGKGKDGNLVESKSRTYVTRPGAGSQFSLGDTSEVAFAGMPRLGAKYDPGSNLIYAIRKNGTEVVVWTAAPSAVISGPDDKVVESNTVNGKKLEETVAIKKKRKAEQYAPDTSSAHAIISQHLQLPEGKAAVTLTPFGTTLPSGRGKNQPLKLIGASGCCEDGSIWIVMRSVNESSGDVPFSLTIIDGSFSQNVANTSRRSGKLRRRGTSEWKVLDSRATFTIESNGLKETNDEVLMSLHSVLFSAESGRVAYRQQLADISDKEGAWSISKVKKSSLTDILQLPQSKIDVAAILDTSGSRITIIHRSDGDGWMLTSATNQSNENPTKSTFPLNCSNDESVFSFGNLRSNISAILTRGNGATSLKLVDFQRRAEISSMSLNRMLQEKMCLAMFTSEMSGLIALLTSPEEVGSVEVLHSQLDIGFSSQTSSLANDISLASSLRLVAQSSTSAKHITELSPKHLDNTNFGDVIFDATSSKVGRMKSFDTIVDEACAVLVSAAKLAVEGDQEGEAQPEPANGGKIRGKRGKKIGVSFKWDSLYSQGCEMITDALKAEQCKPITNGIKVHLSSEESPQLPKTFVDIAFRESALLLLSPQKELHQDALTVLVSILGTQMVSAREDYGIETHRDHLFLRLLKCTSNAYQDKSQGNIGKLDLVDAILSNVRDIPEALLVSILRFVLRSVRAEDAVAFHEKSEHSKPSKRRKSIDTKNEKLSTRLFSQTILNLTDRIVTNSKCNHSFLTKAMQDSISSSAEVETILVTLSKLLKSGRTQEQGDCISDRISLSTGAIDWIAAITDAHMSTVANITNEGGLVLDKLQRAIRSAMLQSEFANELKELVDHTVSFASSLDSASVAAKSNRDPNSSDTWVSQYSIERLAF
jgi:hypothetical protein